VSVATFAAALIAQQNGLVVSEEFLASKEANFRELKAKYPREILGMSLKDANPPMDPLAEIEVQLSPSGVQRVLPQIQELISLRLEAIREIVLNSVGEHSEAVANIRRLIGLWMLRGEIVRVIGAGRALLAASIPANRLAHGGATVSILGDRSPLPNSKLGGGIVAVSASGKTGIVLDIMRLAQEVNKERELLGQPRIMVVGLSNSTATEFASLCTQGHFVGIRPEAYVDHIELRALGDLEEYALSELFDALVVAAGFEIGANFRTGHEDLVGSATGPWHQH